MIAVVKEKNDLAADLLLEPARGGDLREEKAFRKKSARLLPETDDRRTHGRDSALRCPNVEKWRRNGRRSAPSLPAKLIGL
jgi:hypothetical protein